MLIKYVFNSGASTADISVDLAKLISNADIASLSSACDKDNTKIIANSIVSNWEYLEYYGGRAIVRSLNADGTSYKYAGIQAGIDNDATTTIAYNTAVTMYENWNTTTHIGLNPSIRASTFLSSPCGRYSTGSMQLAYSGGPTSAKGSIMLYASERFAIIDGVYAGEFSRESASINSSYPCSVVFPLEESSSFWWGVGGASLPSLGSSVGLCRWVGVNGDMSASAAGMPSIQHADVNSMFIDFSTVTNKFRRPDESEFIWAVPLHVRAAGNSTQMPKIRLGQVQGLLVSGPSGIYANMYDEAQVNGETYILVGKAMGYVWAKKG